MAQVIYYSNDDLNTIPDESSEAYYILIVLERMKQASIHQVTLTPNGDAEMTGRIKVGYRAIANNQSDGVEWVSDGYGSDLIIDMANGVQTITFEAAIDGMVVIVETATSGADIRVGVAGW